MQEVALRPSERRSLEVDLFRLNESESYYKLKKLLTYAVSGAA